MKRTLTITSLLTIAAFITAFSAYSWNAHSNPPKCTGAKYCKACKNCTGCAHCAKNGGKCGVCK